MSAIKKSLFLFTALLSTGSDLLHAESSSTVFECTPQPVYKYRPDGTPGREVTLKFEKAEKTDAVDIDVTVKGKKESFTKNFSSDNPSTINILLPEGAGVDSEEKVTFSIKRGKDTVTREVTISPMRYWNIYLYNHSHVDIGYTNTHKNVEILHKTNILEGIRLAEETAVYPQGSRFVWNPEVSWPLERLWISRPDLHSKIIDAIQKGYLGIDASYLNLNTSTCSDEELFHTFKFTRQIQKMSGKPIDAFQQVDIPGMTWGLIPVMVQSGVRYVMSWTNTDRAGFSHEGLDGLPFWWVGPDGESKVIFFQPGKYANSGSMEKGQTTGRPWFGQRDPSKVPPVIKTGHANVNFTAKLTDLEKQKYPYDFCVLSWSLWDNNPLDADIPEAVKKWNETYAYPKIIISGSHEIMSMIESKYGDKLPVVKGDYTEYWTDGLGTAAGLTALNRNARERLVQAETVWSMLSPGKPAPRGDFDEAWRYIGLGSEHTWCAENPSEPFFQKAIWKVKQSYFHEASDRSISLLEESLAPVTDKSNGALGPAHGPANGGITVLNTQSWKHGGAVILSPEESLMGDKVVDDHGNERPSQRLSTGELLFVAGEIPALGSAHYRVVKGKPSLPAACKAEGTTISNELVSVTVDPRSGNIVSLKRTGDPHNYIDEKVDGGANSFSWLPANVDAPEADQVTDISVTENGPAAVELRVRSKARGCRSLSRSIRVVQGQPWVEITNTVDKLPLLDKDGIHFGFGFNVPGSKTRVDIPWGIMEVEKDQWKQANRNWLAVQRWLDVSNEEKGVTWCSLDAPLFEYGGRHANISLSWGGKGPWLRKLEPSSTIYSWVMNNHWHTNFPLTQDGPVTFRYRILPHNGYNAFSANRFGLEQSQPLVHVPADKASMIKPRISLDNDKVYVTILKPDEQGNSLIVRLRSLSDKKETVTLSFPSGQPRKINICEREEEAGTPVKNNQLIMNPYGMAILKLDY